MRTFFSNHRILCMMILFGVLAASLNAMATPLHRIAVVPFSIHAEKKFAYLQQGTTEMLSFGLSEAGRVELVDPARIAAGMEAVDQPLNDATARNLGRQLEADIIVFGSVAIFGSTVSLSGMALEVAADGQTVRLSRQLTGIDGIIPEIKGFAADIKNRLISPGTADAQKSAENAAPQPKPTAVPSIIHTPEAASRTMQGFWKSERLNLTIRSLAVADIDQDRQPELLILTPHTLEMYRMEAAGLVKINTIAKRDGLEMIHVDAADLNRNGVPEIFVTSLNALQNRVSSFVLEFQRDRVGILAKDLAWYFQVIDPPAGEPALLGQHQKTGRNDIFSGAVYRMHWKDGEYQPASRVLPEHRANLMGCACGDIQQNGQELCATLSEGGSMRIMDPDGTVVWKGSDSFAALPVYFKLPKDEPGVENRQYFPARIIVNPTGRNGAVELIVAKNPNPSPSILNFFSANNQTQLVSLAWDGLGLATTWKTRPVSGNLTGYTIADVDRDGSPELVAGLVQNSDSVVGSDPKSVVVTYDLQP